MPVPSLSEMTSRLFAELSAWCRLQLTDAIEEGLFLALAGAAIPIHSVHIIALLTFGAVVGVGWKDLAFCFSKYLRMRALSSLLTSVCIRRRSRGPPVHAPEAVRVRFRSGPRPFGPGRCTQHAAPRPCTGRQRQELDQFPKLSKLSPSQGESIIDARCR